MPGGVQSVQEGPEGVRDEHVDGTNAPCRHRDPGERLDLQMESRGVEVDQDRRKVVDSAGHDGIRPRSKGNERVVETNALCRDNRPGGHSGERVESGEVGGKRERQCDGNGVGYDGRRCRKDGATSSARRESKRLKTRLLAETEEGQYERRHHMTDYAPGPSTPPPCYARSLSAYVDPPRRQGRLKPQPRRVSHPRWTYQATWTCRGRIGRIRRSTYVAYGPWGGAIPSCKTRRRKRRNRSRTSAHMDSATTISRGTTSILGNRSSAAPQPFTGHHTDSNSFVYQSFGIHSFDSIFHLLGQTLTVICLPFRV